MRQAKPELALQPGRVERVHRHARLERGDQQGVVHEVAALEVAGAHALERDALDRRALHVGVHAHVPEEHPVGLRDRLLAHGHGLCAGEAVAQEAESVLHGARALARLNGHAAVHEP